MLEMLTCPMCRSDVSPRSASCRMCHLPIADVTRHQGGISSKGRTAVRTRLWGLVIYAGIVAWCLFQLPTAAAFVVPAAVAAGVLHVLRGRPFSGAMVFLVIVVVAPTLLWPSMATNVMDDLGSRF